MARKQSRRTSVESGAEHKNVEEPKDEIFDVNPRMTDVYHYGTGLDLFLICVAFILAIAAGFGMPVSMILFGNLFDGLGTGNDDAVTDLVVLMIIIGTAVGVLLFFAVTMSEISVMRQLRTMKKAFFKSILSLDMAFFDKNSESLFTKLNAAIVAFKNGAGRKFILSTLMISMFFGGFILGFIRSWKLTTVLLVPIPLMAGAGFIWGKAMSEGKAKEELRNARANDICEESINAIRTVVSFGLEDPLSKRYNDKIDTIESDAVKSALVSSSMMGSVMSIMFLTYALGFWYSGVLVRQDIVDPCCIYSPLSDESQKAIQNCADMTWAAGGIVPSVCDPIASMFQDIDSAIRGEWYETSFNTCDDDKTCFTGGRALGIFFSVVFGAMGLGQAGPMINAFIKAAGSITSLKALTNLPTPLNPFEHKDDAPKATVADIEFKDVAFAYPTRPDTNIFSKLNITIPKGKTTALVGGSGCGKSTIIQLLERYYDHLSGSITCDSVSLSEMNISEWRDRIAIIPQEPRLFSLSIIENIRMGNRDATDEECIRASMQANAHNFIIGFPEGYHTFVGTGGSQLSGGQKQRVCIARSLLRKPEILILDEATSALDNKSERVVQATLNKILEASGRTTIVIAHRLSTIRNADNIIVLERQGNEGSMLKEQGSHDELIAKQGVYFDLVEKQKLEGLGELDLSNEAVVVDIDEVEVKKVCSKMTAVLAGKGTDKEKMSQKEKKKTDSEKKKKDKAKAKETQVPLSRLMGDFMGGVKRFEVVGICCAALNGLTFPIYSIIFSFFLAIFYSYDPEYIKTEASKWALSFVGLAIMVFFANFGQMFFFVKASSNLQARLRKRVFREVLYQDMSYHDQPDVNAGTLVEILAKDVTHISGLVAENVGVMVQAASCLFTSLIIAFVANWYIALAGIAGSIMTMIGGGLEMMLNTDQLAAPEEGEGEIGSGGYLFNEAIMNIKTIGAFNLQNYMMGRFDTVCKRESSRDRYYAFVAGTASGLSQFLQFSANAFIFYIASILMKHDLVDTSQEGLRRFNIAIFSLQMAGFGVAIAAMQGTDTSKGKIGLSEVYKILDRKPLVDTQSGQGVDEKIGNGKGIEMQNVFFSYPTRTCVPIYGGVSMLIPKGKTTALVGSSGCGKSTVIQLLQRLYDPSLPSEQKASSVTAVPGELSSSSSTSDDSAAVVHRETSFDSFVPDYSHGPGHIVFHTADSGALDAKETQIKSLRAQMGLVGQEPILFDASILENIRYGNASATDEECIQASKRANAHNFIQDFDYGYATTVGKMGGKLSGGQKQRIAIARALVREPTILLLDEATSALDSESEEIVQEALNRIMEESRGTLTVVVVAHRLSTIKKADQIVVFEPHASGSRIAEVGTHDELVAMKGGVYHGLCAATQH